MITIVIAAKTRLLRELLCEALNGQSGLTVVATAHDASRALALVEDLEADVAIISIQMPGADQLVSSLADTQVKIVTIGSCDLDQVAVVEDGSLHDIIAAVHGAMHGALGTASTEPEGLILLTPSERCVLQLINEGLSNKEIASKLGIAVPTAKHHVHSILSKLGVHRRGEAAAFFRNPHTVALEKVPAKSRWIKRSNLLHR